MIDEFTKQILNDIAVSLPKYPPLKPGGEATIKEMCPDLSDEEFEYVLSKYTGGMKSS